MTADTPRPTPTTHQRRREERPEWQISDWHCLCGAFGSHDWMGYAFHLEQDVIKKAEAREATGLREALARLVDDASLLPLQAEDDDELAEVWTVTPSVLEHARAALAAAPPEHVHRPEYPSACTGCEHLAADLASRMPPGLAPPEPQQFWDTNEYREPPEPRWPSDAQLDAAYAAGRYAFGTEQRRTEMRAALAAAPQEPRWPSRDELAKALDELSLLASGAHYRHVNGDTGSQGHDGSFTGCHHEDCHRRHAILAALREGAERP